MVGALAAGRAIHRASAHRWAALMLAVPGLAVAGMAEARTPCLALLLAGVAGCTGAFLEVLSITKVQVAFPHDTATVCGALDSMSYGSVLFGLLFAPVLVALVGAVGCLMVVGTGLLLLATAGLRPAAEVGGLGAVLNQHRESAEQTATQQVACEPSVSRK